MTRRFLREKTLTLPGAGRFFRPRIANCYGSRPASPTGFWCSPIRRSSCTRPPTAPQHERTLLWNDPALGITWPLAGEPVIAAKDLAGKCLAEAEVFEGRGVTEVAVVG